MVVRSDNKTTNWAMLKDLWPYLSEFRARMALTLLLLTLAKLANVGVPLVLREIVDPLSDGNAALVMPASLIVAYGLLRLAHTVFGEVRDMVFAHVVYRAIRRISLRLFEHIHQLALRFHLERQTGALSLDIHRGTEGIRFLFVFMVFNILPTIFEILLVIGILLLGYDLAFSLITLFTLGSYIVFTLLVTEWRIHHRKEVNERNNKASTHAIDSFLNYETVKYFNNSAYESEKYDRSLGEWEKASLKNQTSLSVLNIGQMGIIVTGTTSLLWLASLGVVQGELTIGELVMINAFLIQLYMPIQFLGNVYREIRNSLVNMHNLFKLLGRAPEVEDKAQAKILNISQAVIRFEGVGFAYEKERAILDNVNFTIGSRQKVAVVGPSGSGKSSLVRLLFRFYDVSKGRITIDGQDIKGITQESLRANIGIVPQDSVLFNDTIMHNIAYGRPDASDEEVVEAAKAARIDEFIRRLPEGYQTQVGERGLKLSGGEKQRVAIARTLLKNPPILVFDEATSSLDSKTEQAILEQLRNVARKHTSLVIAHRLSTIVDADVILVLDHGQIVEKGTHESLLRRQGIYASMWLAQQQESETKEEPKGGEGLHRQANLTY